MAAEVAVVIKAKDQTKGVFKGVQSRIGGLAKFAGKAFLGVGAGVAVAGAAIAKFTIDAAKVEQSRNTFDKLAQSVGDNLPNALKKMQRATRGMVADQDLFLAGNRFLNMGLAETTDQAAELSEMGSQLALAMGGEATQGMEDFALMLANQSLPRLDTFGISSGRVRERILELMAADKSLTREMAFTAAVMEEGSKAMERVGEQGEGAAAEYAKFKTVLTNLKTEVGRAFLPIMSQLLSKALVPVAKWLGVIIPKGAKVLSAGLQSLGSVLGTLGQYFSIILEDGDFLNDFLSNLPKPIQGVVLAIGKMTAIFKTLGQYFNVVRQDGDYLNDFLADLPKPIQRVALTLGKLFSGLSKVFGGLRKLIKRLLPSIVNLVKKLLPFHPIILAFRLFGKILSRLIDVAKPFVNVIEDIVGAFQAWQDYGFEAFMENISDTLDNLFGSRIAGLAWNFLDMLQGIRDAFGYLIAGNIEAGLDRLRYALGNMVAPEIAAGISNIAGKVIEFAGKVKTGFETLKTAAVGIWQENIFPRLQAIATGVEEWWTSGGLGRTLSTISAGWSKMVAGLTGFYTDHVGPKLDLVKTWVGIWWSGMGGGQGILTKISEGWAKYIADPLDDFYNQHLSGHLLAIRARIGGWWSSLAEGDGVMIRLGAMWNKYLALPIKDFWAEHGGKFETLKTTLQGWANDIRDFIEEILTKLGLIAPEVEAATVGVMGTKQELDADLKPKGFWERVRESISNLGKTVSEFSKKLPFIEELRKELGKIFELFSEAWKLLKEKLPKALRDNWKKLGELISRTGDYARKQEEAGKTGKEYYEGLRNENTLTGLAIRTLERIQETFTLNFNALWDSQIAKVKEFRGEAETQIRPPPAYIDIYYRYHGTPPGGTPGEPTPPGSEYPPGEQPGLPAYQGGGVVPGPIGMPQLGVLHGGERVLTREQARQGRGNYYDFRGASLWGIDADYVMELFEEADLQRRLQGQRDNF